MHDGATLAGTVLTNNGASFDPLDDARTIDDPFAMTIRPDDVLDFWFLPANDPGHGSYRPEWFAKDDAFDDAIRERFAAAIEDGLAGGFQEWDATPRGALARIVLLDQFPRNVFRGTPRAFAGDAVSRAAARGLVERGDDAKLTAIERMFAYLPFEHSEELEDQERSVALVGALAKATKGFEDVLDYAMRHHAIVARFGRFPHRNAVLGRTSTEEERAFLEEPGSSF